jgi:2-polyprenyl-3-methyl-5-hydroxy-6-metoxy-1,4-benzoquinol methylase
MMVERDLVTACFRVFFDRHPENEQVVLDLQNADSCESVIRTFLSSPEYLKHAPGSLGAFYAAAPRRVDVDVEPADLKAMFDRVKSQWTRLGAAEPFWSVLSEEKYMVRNMDIHRLTEFYESGRRTVSHLEAFAGRANISLPAGTCLELGCGTGRVTRHLASRFERVIAVDISPGNLDLCKQYLADAGVTNVVNLLLHEPEEISTLPEFDFLFSTIVLQHNPPPVQKFMITELLSKLRAGGGLFVQLPTSTPDYSFSSKEYLSLPDQLAEMHCLPMPTVFALLHAHGLVPVEVLMDGLTGMYGSHTFFAFKEDRNRRIGQSTPGLTSPASRCLFYLAFELSSTVWMQVLLAYAHAFQPGDPVALGLFVEASQREALTQAVLQLMQRAGHTSFPDVMVLDGESEVESWRQDGGEAIDLGQWESWKGQPLLDRLERSLALFAKK